MATEIKVKILDYEESVDNLKQGDIVLFEYSLCVNYAVFVGSDKKTVTVIVPAVGSALDEFSINKKVLIAGYGLDSRLQVTSGFVGDARKYVKMRTLWPGNRDYVKMRKLARGLELLIKRELNH